MKRAIRDQEIINELIRLKELNGDKLLPEIVVKEAKKESSLLHNLFEWNDSEAAHQYRIWQARELIRCVVTYIKVDDEEKEVNVFVSLSSDRIDGGYRLMTDVLSKADLRAELLNDLREDMRRFEQKYQDITELAGVFTLFKKAQKELFPQKNKSQPKKQSRHYEQNARA